MTVHPSGAMRAATPSLPRPSVSSYSLETGVSLRGGAQRRNQRMVADMLRASATSAFLSGSPWAIELAVGRDDQREAVLADADAIDHPPHFFEAELADEPAGRLVEPRQVDARTRVGSRSSSTRIGDIATPSMVSDASFGIWTLRRADAARRERAARSRRTA